MGVRYLAGMALRGKDRLRGKTALIVGGAQGTGRVTAELFSAEGANVVIADIAEDLGAEAAEAARAQGSPASFVRTDASSYVDVAAAVEHCIKQHGTLHTIVSSVFVNRDLPITELPEKDWDRIIAVLLKSAYLVAHHGLPWIERSGGGSLLFLASVQASHGAPISPAYTAAKAGLVGLARQLTVDYAPSQVRVNCISPAVILNERNRSKWAGERGTREASGYPLRRLGQPLDIAYALLFLASDEGSFISGVDLAVDGGLGAENGLAVLRERLMPVPQS